MLANPNRRYGAGQPSALYLDGWIYLLYSDSTGRDSNPFNGGGAYVIRSRDPEFQGEVEALTRRGFVSRRNTSGLTTEFKVLDAYSVDWQFCDRLDSFLVAVNGLSGVSTLFSYDRSLRPIQRVDVPGVPWTEGPTITRRMDGHSLPHASGSQTRIPLILFYSIGVPGNPFSYDIGFTGLDLVIH